MVPDCDTKASALAGMEIIEVDWVTAAADWRNFRGVVRTNWLRLTDVDLAGISGSRACLATRIQERYGLSSAQVEQQIRTFEARCEYFRTVSSR